MSYSQLTSYTKNAKMNILIEYQIDESHFKSLLLFQLVALLKAKNRCLFLICILIDLNLFYILCLCHEEVVYE